MIEYLLNTTCANKAFLDVDLSQVKTFPVHMTGEELLEKVINYVGKERALNYCFGAWTNLEPSRPEAVSTSGGYSSEEGRFLGYAHGIIRSSGGVACLWGDSDDPNAEFIHVEGSERRNIFAVCQTTTWKGTPSYHLHEVYDGGELELAKALGTTLEELLIK